MEWAIKEMQPANFGDERLNKRLFSLLDTLGNDPQASIPVACGGWAETKAAYRFFDNEKVNAEKILSPHYTATVERIKHHKTVLLIQDTTTLNYSRQYERTDIGPINHDKHREILLHPTIAVTPDRVCLGVLDNYHWSREEWKVAYMMKYHKIPPKDPLPLTNMLHLIAQFGGYLNRKNDGEPGPTTIWIGLQRLRDFIKAKNLYDDMKS